MKSFTNEPCDTELAEVVKMYGQKFRFFQVKRTTFAFTTDIMVKGIGHFRI